MKKKSNPVSMIAMMALVGILVTFIGGDFNIGSYFEGLEVSSVEEILGYLNIGLGFLALAGVFIFFVFRSARGEKEYFWDFNTDDFREDE